MRWMRCRGVSGEEIEKFVVNGYEDLEEVWRER